MLAKVPPDAFIGIVTEKFTHDFHRDNFAKRMAEFFGIGQDSISRLEQRSDLLGSTLRSYVQAMGGDLQLVVELNSLTIHLCA